MVPLLYFQKHYKPVQFKLWVPDYFVNYAKACLKDKTQFTVRGFSEVQKKFNKDLPTYSFAKHRINNLAMHLVTEAYVKFNTEPPSVEDCNYPKPDLSNVNITKYNLPKEKQYAILCTGFTAPVREWKPEHINKVIDYLLSKDIIPVFLGKSQSYNGAGHTITPIFREEINFHKGINLIDKVPELLETAKIIDGAKLIVGLDNGLLHIAACTKCPIVAGYTTLLSKHRLPYRYNRLGGGCEAVELTDEEFPRRALQSRALFLYRFDFKNAYENDYSFLDLLNGDKYIQAIEKILNNYENYFK